MLTAWGEREGEGEILSERKREREGGRRGAVTEMKRGRERQIKRDR